MKIYHIATLYLLLILVWYRAICDLVTQCLKQVRIESENWVDVLEAKYELICSGFGRFLAVVHIHIAECGNLRRELGRLLAIESR